MSLSPFEVERREFSTRLFGYRKSDVDAFIDEVHRSLRDLWQERGDAREDVERLRERLTRFEQLEDQLKNTLILAQDSAEKAHEQARRESDLMMREASQRSRDIVHSAHEDKQRLEMVLRDLHGAEQEARQRLRAMSGAILSHLDDTEQLVSDSTTTFRAIVQAHPEASELRSTTGQMPAVSVDTQLDETDDASDVVAPVAVPPAVEALLDQRRTVPDGTARVHVDDDHIEEIPVLVGSSDAEDEHVDSVGSGVADTETAHAFFDAPPSFDFELGKPRKRRWLGGSKREQ